MAPKTYTAVHLGCRVNRAELDAVEEELLKAGFSKDTNHPKLVLLITCCVTQVAEAKSRKTARHLLATYPDAHVLVFGCATNLHAQDFCAISPTRLRVCKNAQEVIENAKKLVTYTSPKELSQPFQLPLLRTRPGIVIQTGCNQRCSYCCVWQARGPARSLSIEDVLERAETLIERGAHELVLTGIDVGSYCDNKTHLAELLDALLAKTAIDRIRLSSIEPTSITPDLLEVMVASGGRVAPYLHVPLQSGSDAVLSKMGRKYRRQDYIAIVSRAQNTVPNLALSTDVIVGFPQEREEDFSQTRSLLQEFAFSNLHIFRYSRRENTPAAQMKAQIAPEVKQARAKDLLALAKSLRAVYAQSLVGNKATVCMEDETHGVEEHLFSVEVKNPPLHTSYISGTIVESDQDTLLLKPDALQYH